MYSFLPLHPQIHPRLSVESLDASAKRFIPFLTTPIFLSPSLLSSFQIFQILFFSALLPLSIRVYFVSKDDFTCCEFDRRFCPGERAEYFDEHEPDFSRKIISTNWLGEILKKKKKRENSILLTRSLRRPRCVLGLIRFSIPCNRLIRPSF